MVQRHDGHQGHAGCNAVTNLSLPFGDITRNRGVNLLLAVAELSFNELVFG